MIVADTNVISETLKLVPDEHVMNWLAAHASEITITAVTVGELSLGLEVLPEGHRKADLRRALSGIFALHGETMFVFDALAGQQYGRLIADRRRKGHPLDTEDAMIAAICLTNNLSLATRNVKDFDGLGLNLINPWQA